MTKLDDKCYRIQIVSTDDISNDCCEVKFLDYGGFDKIAVSELWQIRQDFLNLPFQVRHKLVYLCFVHPVFGFWSLLATKLQKYNVIETRLVL